MSNELGFNLQTFVDVELFNTTLRGIYEVKTLTDGKKTTVVVLPTDPEPKQFTLAQFVEEANKIINNFSGANIDAKEIENKLKDFGIDLENISVQLRQLFVYMNTRTFTEEGKEEQKSLQYAFNVTITNTFNPPSEMTIFRIKKVGIAVYKTEFKFVIDRMELIDIDSLLV